MSHALIFAYGTLRTNARNWATYLAPRRGRAATTAPQFTMRCIGCTATGYPVVEAHGNTEIQGELFEVDASTLASIDDLEGHPTWYCREVQPVWLPDQTVVEAWIYLMPTGQYPDAPIIESGNWLAASD